MLFGSFGAALRLLCCFLVSHQSSLMPLLHVAASLLICRIFYQKYGFALSACRSFFPKSCAFGEFQCRFERVCAFGALRLLLLLLQKGTLGSSVRLQANSLTAHCRCRLFASMSGCKFFYSSSHFVSLRKKSAAHLIGETRRFFNLDFVAVF